MVRECNPPARDPTRSWLARRQCQQRCLSTPTRLPTSALSDLLLRSLPHGWSGSGRRFYGMTWVLKQALISACAKGAMMAALDVVDGARSRQRLRFPSVQLSKERFGGPTRQSATCSAIRNLGNTGGPRECRASRPLLILAEYSPDFLRIIRARERKHEKYARLLRIECVGRYIARFVIVFSPDDTAVSCSVRTHQDWF
jgi:hypothetical protein